MRNISIKEAKKINNIRPLQEYKLNDKEVFRVSKVEKGLVFGGVTPIEYINDTFVIVDRFIWLDIFDVLKLKLLKDFKGRFFQ